MNLQKLFILAVFLGTAMISGPASSSALAASGKWSASGKLNESARDLLTDAERNETEIDPPAGFYSVLETILAERRLKREHLCDETDPVQRRILNDYGAVFLASGRGVQPPSVCVFAGEREVADFQISFVIAIEEIDGVEIELQAAAMSAYLAARQEARAQGLNITPRDGAEAGRRSFADTVRLWNSRFLPAADYWGGRGRLAAAEVEKLKSMPVNQQVREVLNLERRGIFFNSSFNGSIIYSIAPPGSSQHISMLALDVNEFREKKVREILARHGWFRTVKSDAPHFTFLGRKTDELKKLGLKKFTAESGEYWIPNV